MLFFKVGYILDNTFRPLVWISKSWTNGQKAGASPCDWAGWCCCCLWIVAAMRSLLRQKSRFVALDQLAAESSWCWINYTGFSCFLFVHGCTTYIGSVWIVRGNDWLLLMVPDYCNHVGQAGDMATRAIARPRMIDFG